MSNFTPEEITRWMAEAGAGKDDLMPRNYDGFIAVFTKVATAAALAEREECAKICDQRKDQSRNHLVRSGLAVAALDIRARGAP